MILLLGQFIVAAVLTPAAVSLGADARPEEFGGVDGSEDEVGGVEGAESGAEDVELWLVEGGFGGCAVLGCAEGPVVPDGDERLLNRDEEVGEADREVLDGYSWRALEGVGAREEFECDLLKHDVRKPLSDLKEGDFVGKTHTS